jgi:hypothetical protein
LIPIVIEGRCDDVEKKKWKDPVLEVLNIKMTFKGGKYNKDSSSENDSSSDGHSSSFTS